MLTTEDLPAAIKKHRKLKGFSQKRMAEELFISLRAYQRIEYGENKNIDIATVQKIVRALGISVSVLLENAVVTPGYTGKDPDKRIPPGSNDIAQAYEEIIVSLREIIAVKDELIRQLMSLCDRE